MKKTLTKLFYEYIGDSVLIILMIFITLVYFLRAEPVLSFTNSSNFSNIILLIGGLVTFRLYKRTQFDKKRDVANIILLEIQNAENNFRAIFTTLNNLPSSLPEDIIVMPTESWNRYKYLFVNDFDKNQWNSLNNFYSDCQLLDNALNAYHSSFQKNEEQYRVNIQKTSCNYVKEFLEKPSNLKVSPQNEKQIQDKIDLFTSIYLKSARVYTPQKPMIDAKRIISVINTNLSLTSVGDILKKFSKG